SSLELSNFVGLYSFNHEIAGTGDMLTVADEDTLKDLPYVGPGLAVVLDCVTSPGLFYTNLNLPNSLLIVDNGAILLGESAAFPGYVVPGVAEALFQVFLSASAILGNGTVALIAVASGGSLSVVASLASVVADNALTSEAGASTFVLNADSSVTSPLPLTTSPAVPLTLVRLDQYTQLSGGAYTIFRPGGVRAGNVSTNFGELQADVNAGAVTVYVDSSLAAGGIAHLVAGSALVPPTGGAIRLLSFNGSAPGFASADALTVDNGATITDLAYVSGITLTLECSTAPALLYPDAAYNLLQLDLGATVQLGAGATVPAYTSTAGALQVGVRQNAYITGVAGAPCFLAGNGGVLEFFGVTGAGLTATSLGTAVGGALAFINDASVSVPAFSFAAGLLLNFPYDQAQN